MNTDTLRKLRIFAASPHDVANERARLAVIVEDLRALAEHVGVALDLLDWSKVVPDFGRPEQVILDQLKPDTWDVFIGILWHRFGTPPKNVDPATGKEYLSGTEEEFRVAYRLWKQYQRPRVIFYWCKCNPPFDEIDPVQVQRVKDFFAGFAPDRDHPGLYQTFDSIESFDRLVRKNLTIFLLDYSEQVNRRVVSMQEVQVFVPTVPDNLPRRASFFGRSIEMAKVLRALGPEERSWGAVIDGIGGIGKTALAIEVAYCCKDQCLFDAFIFVSAKQKRLEPSGLKTETRSATTLDEFINETARALGKPAIARLMGEDKRRALLDALRTTRVLLVYDNLETLTKEEQETLVDWLRFLPQGCKAILTSRRRAGESALWLRLEKLDWETARAIIQHESAREMRLETLWHVDETRWHQLYEETGGSPLALIWTLGLMRTRPLTFDRALEMLRQGSSRESDLQKFIYEEARRELGASDMAVLEALSLFVPSATFGALMFTANLSRTALEAVLERLSALSLVDEVGETEEQYSLHPLTRRFARADLADDTETESVVGQRFSRYWVNYAQRYGGWGKDSYKTFNRLETEWENLYATASWLYEVTRKLSDKAGSPEVAQMLVDLASTLSFFLSFSGRWDEHIQLNEWAYDTVRDSENWRSAGWRAYDLAWMNYKRAHISDATLWLERCSEAWERGGTKGDHATALRLRGLIAQYHNEFGKAEQLLQEALNIRRSLGAHREVAFALTSLGQLAQERKDHDAAQRYFLEALELEHSVNDLAMHAGLCNHLGILALDRGRWDEALDWFQQSLSLAHEVGRVELIANSQHGLARVNEAIGHPDSALPLALEALKIYERLQDKRLAETRKLVERLKKQAGGK